VINPFNDIKNCRGKENCFGKKTRINPIVFSMPPDEIKIMVITEQPRGDRVKKEDLKRAFHEGPRNSIPQRLGELLGDQFHESVKNENGMFYWTHHIKCPGEFRKLKNKMGIDIDKCADTFLMKEIEYIKPSLIVSVGGKCGSWILKTFKDPLAYKNNDWREHLWREISERKITKIRAGDTDVQVIFLVHPSERSGIGWYIDKKLKDMIDKTINKIKR
jgi:uracil-DNA glycosylase